VHKLCQQSAGKLLADFNPTLMIAIGGGGYVPARILRSFLKQPGSPNIPIQAIGLSLYETLGGSEDTAVEAPGTKVTRTQWLDLSAIGEMENLVGKHVLIVDEVDDTRTTLEYAVKELEKDVEAARKRLGGDQPETKFSIFVLHVRSRPPSDTGTPPACASPWLTTCRVTEQGQAQEGKAPGRHDGHAVLGRPHCRRRLDLLPLGGHRHRGARPDGPRPGRQRRQVSEGRGARGVDGWAE
jgi:hypoxanthine phosphoribosyltransferase